MTIKDTADRTGKAMDFTMMYVTHDAFRRDLGRFTAAAAAGTAPAWGPRGWENFKAQLLLHHSVEDTDLWPRVRRAAATTTPAAGPAERDGGRARPDRPAACRRRRRPGRLSQQPRRACRRASRRHWSGT